MVCRLAGDGRSWRAQFATPIPTPTVPQTTTMRSALETLAIHFQRWLMEIPDVRVRILARSVR